MSNNKYDKWEDWMDIPELPEKQKRLKSFMDTVNSATTKEILNATKDLIKFNSKKDKISTSQIDFKNRYFEYAQHRNLAANIAPSFIEINKNLF